ncbi:MAG: response regulator [Deltaproteobacteria bacterium]|jgi:signal transduction histidine kinase/DNA-binding NarL/FixJ family response regulator|nr:response regulator [Deltaproteobacteria bacterium]
MTRSLRERLYALPFIVFALAAALAVLYIVVLINSLSGVLSKDIEDRLTLLSFLLPISLFLVTGSGLVCFYLYMRHFARILAMDEQTKIMFDATPLACSFRSEEGDFLDCNKEMLNMFGAGSFSELAEHFRSLTPEKQPDGAWSSAKMAEYVREALETGSRAYEWMYFTISGEPLPVEVSMTCIPWKDGRRLVCYSRDLRESKANEQKMREKDEGNRRLEVETRAARLASKAKSEFLATMSHEIRTPLNAVIGLSEVEMQGDLPESTRDNIEKIYRSGNVMLGLINDVLDISKIESGNFALVPACYDLASMLNDVVQRNVLRIGSKNISFKLDLDETIPRRLHGDELRVKQVFNNLLSNAFKYTEEGEVRMRVGWQSEESGGLWLELSVSDTGCGISGKDLAGIFMAYAQFDVKAGRHMERTGLGLPITKNLVEMMGGSVSVHSESQKGSVFSVRMSQGIARADPVGPEVAAALRSFNFFEPGFSRGKKMPRAYMPYGKVLVVDDVRTNLDVVRGFLLPYGLDVDYVSSGQEAVDRVREAKKRYDLIFMDHMMPVMDGIETVRVIREEIGTDYARAVPIVALTANALVGNREMFMARGFNGFISKPIDITRLDSVLNKWVRDVRGGSAASALEAREASVAAEDAAPPSGILEGRVLVGVDLLAGTARYDNEAVYLQILRSYASHIPPLLEKMRAASAGGLHDYAVTVHGIKGASNGICALPLAGMAEEMELAAKAGDWEKVRAGNPALLHELAALLQRLEEFLSGFAPQAAGVNPRMNAPDKNILAALLDACRRFRISEMEELLHKLESFDYDSGTDLIQGLRRQTDNLEYEEMAKKLEEMLGHTL